MLNYPLHKINKDGTLLNPSSSYYSDEYAEKMYDLHLKDEYQKDENGRIHRFYRLYARYPHNIEMALQYDIHCPNCSTGMLKQVGRCLNSHELGLYVCPKCDKR